MLKIVLMLYSPQEHDEDPARMVGFARAADEAGLYSLAMGEHLAMSADRENYPYGSATLGGLEARYLEPVATLGAFSAVTSRIRLSTSIMLAPLRPALLLAKQLAALDVLSHGRLEPALGLGWNKPEFDAMDLDFKARRRILLDSLGACRALWGEQPASFQSETVSFNELCSHPRPVQKRIPILLAMKPTQANAEQIAILGDGWETGPEDAENLGLMRQNVDLIRAAFSNAGRDPDSLMVRTYLPLTWKADGRLDVERSLDAAGPLVEAGVNQFIMAPFAFSKTTITVSEAERLIDEIGRVLPRY